MAELLSLKGVQTHIGPYHILHGVDFVVPEGGVTMLLGRNGAGKTTTLRTIMGMWKPSAGEILFDGKPIGGMATPDVAMSGISYVPEDMSIFSDLTVEENMMLAARAGEIDMARLKWIFGLFPALEKFWRTASGVLSGGQKQMLSIARSIVEPRKLVVIDEPTKGLSPVMILSVIEAFKELKATNTTVLMVEQNFHCAKTLGDSVAVMDNGKIVHTGMMADLAADEALQQRLLGLSLDSHQ